MAFTISRRRVSTPEKKEQTDANANNFGGGHITLHGCNQFSDLRDYACWATGCRRVGALEVVNLAITVEQDRPHLRAPKVNSNCIAHKYFASPIHRLWDARASTFYRGHALIRNLARSRLSTPHRNRWIWCRSCVVQPVASLVCTSYLRLRCECGFERNIRRSDIQTAHPCQCFGRTLVPVHAVVFPMNCPAACCGVSAKGQSLFRSKLRGMYP
jgi:hypothetical protein